MTKRIQTLIAALLITLGVSVFGASSASATEKPNTNKVSYWCEGGLGVKYEPVSAPYVVPAPPAGYQWTLLVIKAGSTGRSVVNENFVVQSPVVGKAYSHPEKDSISHVILCKKQNQTTTTTTTQPEEETTTTTTPPTSTVPETTVPETTQPPVTTVPVTTEPPATTQPPVTTVPATTVPEVTTTVPAPTVPPSVAPTSIVATTTPPVTDLPATGGGTTLGLLALILIAAGTTLLIVRRPTTK